MVNDHVTSGNCLCPGPFGCPGSLFIEVATFAGGRLVDPGGRPLRTAEVTATNALTTATLDAAVIGSAAIADAKLLADVASSVPSIAETTGGCTAKSCIICAAAVAFVDAIAVRFLATTIFGSGKNRGSSIVVGCLLTIQFIECLSYYAFKTYLRICKESKAAAVFNAVAKGIVCCFARCAGILAVADFAAARAKASRSGELETLCSNDEELADLDFGSVPELEVDFGFFKELHGAAVEVVAVSGSAKLPFDGLAFLSSSEELDSTTRLRRPG